MLQWYTHARTHTHRDREQKKKKTDAISIKLKTYKAHAEGAGVWFGCKRLFPFWPKLKKNRLISMSLIIINGNHKLEWRWRWWSKPRKRERSLTNHLHILTIVFAMQLTSALTSHPLAYWASKQLHSQRSPPETFRKCSFECNYSSVTGWRLEKTLKLNRSEQGE